MWVEKNVYNTRVLGDKNSVKAAKIDAVWLMFRLDSKIVRV